MAEALVMLVVLAIFLGIIGLLVFAVATSAINMRKQREDAWARVAHGLGLQVAGGVVFGRLNGQQVSLRTEVRGSGKSKKTYTVVASALTLPLDLGLRVTQQGFFDDALATLGLKSDVMIGDPVFDASFVIGADEPHRVKALLTPELKHALSTSSAESLMLTDVGFSMSRLGVESDERWLVWALRTAADVLAKVKEARKRVPPASPLAEHRAEWKRFAAATGLRRMSTPLCMWGELEGTRISAHAVRVGPLAYRMEVTVHFDLPLHLGLLIRPGGAFDELASFFGSQDHRLRDPVFDSTFVVKAARPERLAEVFDEETRRRLVDLNRRCGAIQVNDEGLTLRSASMAATPRAIPPLVGHLREVAKRISESAEGRSGVRAGPYR